MKRFVFIGLLFSFFYANSQFAPGNIVVSRVGDGTAALSNASAQVQLVEYTVTGVATGVVVTLPVTTAGTAGNRACTNSGSSTTEGIMTLSYDGRYLVHTGYDAIPGVVGISTSNTDPNRTIARIDASGNIDISTSFLATTGNAYVRNSIRSATTIDGTSFWTSGTSSSTNGGVRYLTLGQDNIAGTQISTTITNTRGIQIVDDQLYISAQSGTIRIATVGSGTPTISGQTITNLPANIPTTATNPVSFIFFDRDASIAGPDLLYYLSQSSTAGEFGLYKYSFDGTNWIAQGKLADATTNNSQASGLTGYLDCSGNVVLFLTRAIGSTSVPSEIRSYTDNAAYNLIMTGNGTSILSASTLLVTAATNYAFRGITLSPATGYNVTGSQNIAAGNYNVITVKSGGTATLTGDITVYDRVVVEAGGTLDMGNFVISSPIGIGSRFEVKSGGSIKVGHSNGITASAAMGNVQTCFRSYNSGANYEYIGTATQTTGDGLPTNLSGTLRINNSAGIATTGVSLSQGIIISGTLNLSLGKFTTNAANLASIDDGATVINASSTSFVQGPMKKIGATDFAFPVGEGGIYAPITISGGTGGAATDAFIATYFRTDPRGVIGNVIEPPINHISYAEYWELTQDFGSASKIVTLDIHSTSFSKTVPDTYVSRFDGTKWIKIASTSSSTGPCANPIYDCGTTASSIALNAFGSFTLATDLDFISNPLPVKLINFSATKISSGLAIINWELAACCSKDALFELEKSTDSRNFTLISSIDGSETNKFYFYNDSRLGKGISYYRLKMTDTDGSVKYSKVIAIVNEEKGFVITSIAPNPVQHTASLTISAAKQSSVDFKVYDVAGNLVKQWQSTIAAGNNVLQMDVAALTNGTYHVLASSSGDKTVFRFIKQ